MASSFTKISAKKISIKRQGAKQDQIYVTWGYTNDALKKKIKQKVYNSKTKSNKTDSKSLKEVLDGFQITFYYLVGKTWYKDKEIKVGKGTKTTKADLWNPPAIASSIKVSVKPLSKKYTTRTNTSGTPKTAEKKWFSETATEKTDKDYDEYPDAPSISEWSIDGMKYKLTVSFTNEDNDLDIMEYQIYKDGVTQSVSQKVNLDSEDEDLNQYKIEGMISTVGQYQARARVGSKDSDDDNKVLWSGWSAWSQMIDTRPVTPKLINAVATSDTSIRINWSVINGITDFDISYVSSKVSTSNKMGNYNFNTTEVQTQSVSNVRDNYTISGLEAGKTWYFMIRSKTSSGVVSEYSNVVSATLAIKPSPPTTWSSTTRSAIASSLDTTKNVYLYFTHNSKDGSAMRTSIIQINIGGTFYYARKDNTNYQFSELVDEINEVNLWRLPVYTSESCVGTSNTVYNLFVNSTANMIKWKVKTKGLHADYSDWSMERSIEAYVQPNLNLRVVDNNGNALPGDILTSFPLRLIGQTTPSSQTPIGYSIDITTDQQYDTTDIYGNDMTISPGYIIYKTYLDINTQLDFKITASDVDFVSGILYTLTVVVTMDSGMSATATYKFTPEWEETGVSPNAYVSYNPEYKTANITPYCEEYLGFQNDIDTEVDDDIPEQEVQIFYSTNDNSKPVVANYGDILFVAGICKLYSYDGTNWVERYVFDYQNASNWHCGVNIDAGTDYEVYENSEVQNAVINEYYFNLNTGDIYKCVKSGDPESAVWSYVWNVLWKPVSGLMLNVYRKTVKGSFVTIAENILSGEQAGDSAITVTDLFPTFGVCTYRIVAVDETTGAISYEDIELEVEEDMVVIQWEEQMSSEYDFDIEQETVDFKGTILELRGNVKLSDSNNIDVTMAEYIGRTRPVTYYGTQEGESSKISCEIPKEDTESLSKLRHLMSYHGDVYIRELSGLGYWANVNVSYDRNYKEMTIPISISVTPVEAKEGYYD